MRWKVGAALFALAILGGCAPRPSPPALPEGTRLVRAADGAALSFEALLDELEGARAIYVGERHDSPADHAAERAIAEGLFARDPSLVVGLEMFDREAQPALDAFTSGAIDEATFLERCEYADRWGYDFALLRPLFAWAREEGVRVVGLNARRELTRAVAERGIAGLSPGERARLPSELVLDHAAHRAMIFEALAHHPGLEDAQRERYYEAQVVWDETMGESVARALEGGARRIVVFAGATHVTRGLGVPRTAARRGVTPYRVVLPLGPDEADAALAAPPGERPADVLFVHPAARPGG